ncbi:MAG: hypothetical protein L0387_16010 [Acidobacteria bacterium]|nr:hypothetical protein [Acidobacteriota bacterium]
MFRLFGDKHVFIWPDYIDPGAVADFEREFDCNVTFDFYESVDAMMLRRENIPNFRNIDPQFVNPTFDLGNRHSVPTYLWGTTGIYLRKPKDKPLEETWGLIFDKAKQPGPFLLEHLVIVVDRRGSLHDFWSPL